MGGEPYCGTIKQKKKVELWKSKNSSYYSDSLITWTIKDPLKRKTAKDNKLNYFEFFNMNQFIDWFNKQ